MVFTRALHPLEEPQDGGIIGVFDDDVAVVRVHPSSHLYHLWSFGQEVQNPVASRSRDSYVCQRHDQSALAYCVECRTVVQKEHPGICFAVLQVLQGVVEGYCYSVVH